MKRLLSTLAACLGTAALLRAAPANDLFADRTHLAGTNLVVIASNVGATKEPGEPEHANRTGNTSVWWTWQAPADGDVVVSTAGSSFDTVLAIYVGSALEGLQVLAGNDDDNGLSTSRAAFQARAGTDYHLVVDGLNGAAGEISLTLTFHSPPGPKPANDNFLDRTVLAGPTVNANGTNVDATRELGEPSHAGEFGTTSLWWTWTAPSTGPVHVTTANSDFDTLLAIYTGSTLSNLTAIASNDDDEQTPGARTSALMFDATVGQVFHIAVDGFDGASGAVSLSVQVANGQAAPTLGMPEWLPGTGLQLWITGSVGAIYEVMASPDLSTWSALGTVTNRTGTVGFLDAQAGAFAGRFCRARVAQ